MTKIGILGGGLLSDLIAANAQMRPGALALQHGKSSWPHAKLAQEVSRFAGALAANGVQRFDRVAIYLEQRIETVTACFGAAAFGGIFVPVNPVLRPKQVGHILQNCEAAVLLTSPVRLKTLEEARAIPASIRLIILADAEDDAARAPARKRIAWADFIAADGTVPQNAAIDFDPVAILYTSGSTGLPKGVVLSHRNMVAGARSVASYLKLASSDRVLCALPLSFDAGFSQLTSSFAAGASAVLANHILPSDIPKLVRDHGITGLCAVPPLWRRLATAQWQDERENLRFIANTGGAMDRATLAKLRALFPRTDVYLMYGFTEAFRSTYLDPEEVDRHPDSIGKAIPNAEVLVLRDDGSPCAPGETGELVHRGALVARGYWGDPEATAKTFRPFPVQPKEVQTGEIAAWSGDLVRRDEEGFLYFIGRRDEMIKSSGYRVSAEEIEAVLSESGMVQEVCVIGVPHPDLGQAIIAIVAPVPGTFDSAKLMAACQKQLPSYMVPKSIVARDALRRNANGKIDRKFYRDEFLGEFEHATA